MEESWLEKLIELFRDYVENYWNDTKDPTIDNVVIYDWQWFYFGARFYSDEKVLSKKFWFIKRLVENDKIDYDKIGEKIWIETHKAHFPVNKYWYVYDLELGDVSSADYSDYESLLMLLSISDTPIDDLLLYLK